MTDVQFQEEETFTSRQILGAEVVPWMTTALIKTGVVKDSKQAEYTLIGIMCVSIILTIAVLYFAYRSPSQKSLTPAEQARIQQMMVAPYVPQQ